jgi:alginate O-acetyltransferase complex protein AlgI
MTFISFEFIIFFIIVFIIYFSVNHRWRWVLLLSLSYFFYMYWNASYIVLIVASTLVDYFVALQLDATDPTQLKRRKILLSTSITINLGILFFFKYFNFFNTSVADALHQLGISYTPSTLDVLLPVGISFYTFQSMAYTFDVYRGQLRAEKNVGLFATYVALFPQLVAGPIERAGNIIPQIHREYDFDYHRAVTGSRLILWGVFKKVVIADRLSIYVDTVYNQADGYTGLPLILATLYFGIQLYCDFSAYSDIAIGAARILGFDLMQNFRQPYFSRSVSEFWRRWHISLMTWFRDYLFISMGGSRKSFQRRLINILIVYVVSGLWHGAQWTFVFWGVFNGIIVLFETVLSHLTVDKPLISKRLRLPYPVQWTITYMLIHLGFIFFRGNSMPDVAYIYSHLFDFTGSQDIMQPFSTSLLQPNLEFMIAIVSIIVLFTYDYLDRNNDLIERFNTLKRPLRWTIYYAGFIVIMFSLLFTGTTDTFIYFQF